MPTRRPGRRLRAGRSSVVRQSDLQHPLRPGGAGKPLTKAGYGPQKNLEMKIAISSKVKGYAHPKSWYVDFSPVTVG